jgi:hypothetical protein
MGIKLDLTLREEGRWRAFENRVLSGMPGATREEEMERWRKYTVRSFVIYIYQILLG